VHFLEYLPEATRFSKAICQCRIVTPSDSQTRKHMCAKIWKNMALSIELVKVIEVSLMFMELK
jgi:hypothetical protein